MASGILGSADLVAATNTTVYTVPADKVTTCNISLCNRNTNDVKVRLALAANAAPTSSEYIEYDATIPANGVLERSGVVMNATKKIVAYASSANVTALVYGFEE